MLFYTDYGAQPRNIGQAVSASTQDSYRYNPDGSNISPREALGEAIEMQADRTHQVKAQRGTKDKRTDLWRRSHVASSSGSHGAGRVTRERRRPVYETSSRRTSSAVLPRQRIMQKKSPHRTGTHVGRMVATLVFFVVFASYCSGRQLVSHERFHLPRFSTASSGRELVHGDREALAGFRSRRLGAQEPAGFLPDPVEQEAIDEACSSILRALAAKLGWERAVQGGEGSPSQQGTTGRDRDLYSPERSSLSVVSHSSETLYSGDW